MNKDEEIEAARSSDNVNGEKVKVILESENASEGLDFRNIREVHILDPWYHFNKTEQIVGRAARNCSHASLPVEKRNVTVYLHAARIKGSPRESIDIRAYRIAEQKQRRILRVEALLVANSMDCNLNKHTQYYDPKELNLRLNVVTSQGKVLTNYPIGDRYPRERVICAPDINMNAAERDTSTYDAVNHAGGIHSCKSLFANMFREKHVFTIDEVRAECMRVYPSISDDAIMMAVQQVIDEYTPVKNPAGKDGYVIYVSDKYVFQSRYAFDERDGLNDPSRTGKESLSGERTSIPNAVTFKARQNSSSASSRRGSRRGQHLGDADKNSTEGDTGSIRAQDGRILAEMSIDLLMGAVEDMKSKFRLSDKYTNAVFDFAVDRLDRRAVMSVLREIVQRRMMSKKKAKKNNAVKAHPNADVAVKYDRLYNSFLRGYVLWNNAKEDEFYAFDYFRDRYVCFDEDEQFDIRECNGPALSRAQSGDAGKRVADKMDYRNLMGYVLHPNDGKAGEKARSTALFKLLGVSEESSGCVCHQTSSVKIQDISRMIRAVNDKAIQEGDNPKRKKTFDKKDLCALYEIMLRYHRPNEFARPAVTVRVFRQKGKRMSSSASSSSSTALTTGKNKDNKADMRARPALKPRNTE
jgi:hypothetical protein